MISKNRKKIIVASLILFSTLLLACILQFGTFQPILMDRNDSSHSNLDNCPEAIRSKGSGFWNLTGETIYINGDATGIGAHNWTWAANQDWCNGSGTLNDPYIIENITINTNNLGSGIDIENSTDYFIIRNCTIKNSGKTRYDAGIKLYNVKNGILLNNTCSYNKGMGLSLEYIINCTILNNTANSNNYYGISLSNSNNNTISRNSAISNSRTGIILTNCINNIVLGNILRTNPEGISLSNSNNNTVSNNTLNRNNKGIYLISSNNNTLTGNTLNSRNEGISLILSSNNTLLKNLMNKCGVSLGGSFKDVNSHIIDTSNKVNEKPIYYYVNEIGLGTNNFTDAGQIILINCNNSMISNLNISYSSYGVSLYYCKNNTIANNNISHNAYGLFLSNSNENTISGNIATNNSNYGIVISVSDKNTISENIANYNYLYGILLIYGNENDIISNEVIKNNNGIALLYSNNNFISNNIVNYNDLYGIFLFGCTENTISRNNANYKQYAGILLIYSNENDIISNEAINNIYYGIQLFYSNNNFISKNIVNYNNNSGICLINSNDNTILENTVKSNIEYGLYLNQSNYNYIIGNTFIDNREAVGEENCLINFYKYYSPDDNGGNKKSVLNPFIFFAILIGFISVVCGMAISSRYIYNIRSKSKKKKVEENRFNKPSHLYDKKLSFLSEDFLAKIEQFEWDKGEKEIFLKEMLSLSINEREEILEEMLRESDLNNDSK